MTNYQLHIQQTNGKTTILYYNSAWKLRKANLYILTHSKNLNTFMKINGIQVYNTTAPDIKYPPLKLVQ